MAADARQVMPGVTLKSPEGTRHIHVRRGDIAHVYRLWQQWGFQLAKACG